MASKNGGRQSRQRSSVQCIKSSMSRIQENRRRRFAAEQEILDAAPTAFHQSVTPSCGQRRPQLGANANLAIGTTETIQRQGAPTHGALTRSFTGEDRNEWGHREAFQPHLVVRSSQLEHGKPCRILLSRSPIVVEFDTSSAALILD
jgi:hypothetical protein